MTDASRQVQGGQVIEQIRRDFAPVVDQLLQHPYVQALEDGRVPREQLRIFAGEQHVIILSDLRSVAHLVSRFGGSPSREFFVNVLEGEKAALQALDTFGAALQMGARELDDYEPLPGAHAYTCYMAWLALYGSEAEVAAAYLVNFPAWGQNCGRVSRILTTRYGFRAQDVVFFDLFAAPAPDFERSALATIAQGLDSGTHPRLIHRSARLLQAYELLYWDALYQASLTTSG